MVTLKNGNVYYAKILGGKIRLIPCLLSQNLNLDTKTLWLTPLQYSKKWKSGVINARKRN